MELVRLADRAGPEVIPFGITVLITRPGAVRTSFAGTATAKSTRLTAYEVLVGALRAQVDEACSS